ncbi:MAG: helix-turn-helix domain-containing protein [Bradyrhizobium sp.]|uniref:helix-turn-helix domain-containing protein n=1 Tax=Bradyrhizobium sp. TaxID=376 RepID=UPI00272F5ACE|nr:helix-turn-helix domain-containing protein [Bradyrhizobium sp.]MDP1864954.1 helix-turn-helix domain-containing protein [Bradyrhizobium sp.]
MPDSAAPVAFQMVRRLPSQRTAGLISAISGYREMAAGRFSQREAAPLAIPLIISFGTPFTIALGRVPDAADRHNSFAAGLYAGAVYIESDGGAECVQVDFTPLGAFRFFGGAVGNLAARMIEVGDVLGADGTRLRERLGATEGWQRRFDIVEEFVADRANHLPSPELEFAWRLLARRGGGIRIATLAEEIGWSRKHLVELFRHQFDLGPKSIARMMRFHRASGLARAGTPSGWAGIAADSGFSDQAHLIREFTALAGEPPTARARRMALTDSRLTRLQHAEW